MCICLGFNAGIASDSYTTWNPTLQILLRERTPAVFTEFSHYSAQLAANRIDRHRSAFDIALGHSGGGGTAVTMNPFRSPVRYMQTTGESNIPSYCNAFIIAMC